MLTFYWLCFIGGGFFVLLAVLGGLDGVDLDGEGLDTDIELAELGRSHILLLGILRSFKFSTFGACFFGLTGIVMSELGLPGTLVFLLAASVGLLLGGGITLILASLHTRQADSLTRSEELVGQLGVVELPFDAASTGKVRLQIRGSTIDFIAYTDDVHGFRPGETVLVVGTKNNRLWVVGAEQNSGHPPLIEGED